MDDNSSETRSPATTPAYRAPGWFTRNVFNRAVARATRLGLSVWGARLLELPGRRSGVLRRTPVNLLSYEGASYLVAARGHTEWVRNLGANRGQLTLIRGRHHESWEATELADAEKVPVLRAYLKRWKAEVGVFFAGVGPNSTDAEIAAIAADHPVFRITPAPSR